MKPTALTFSRYRAFRESTRIDLAPLTIIIGKNGSGKSVLTRFPLLLSGGLTSTSESPLDLTAGEIVHAARYEDLIYQQSSQPFSMGAEASDGTNRLRFVTTMHHIVERHGLGVESFELYEDDTLTLSLTISRLEDLGKPESQFLITQPLTGATQAAAVSFAGLFPVLIGDTELNTQIRQAHAQFQAAFADPSYLGPFRSENGASLHVPRQGVKRLGPRGEHTLDVMGDDRLRHDGRLVAAVEDWFELSMKARVNLIMSGDFPRISVHDSVRNVDVGLESTGAGFAQLLPIVVQAFARGYSRIDTPLLIIEQPELHLHPGVHGEVADLLINTVERGGGKFSYICETHSEQIVTRIRRRIAEGLISSKDVVILSVGHQSGENEPIEPVRPILLDEFGTPDAWPVGVFDEAFSDLVCLRNAAQARESRQEVVAPC